MVVDEHEVAEEKVLGRPKGSGQNDLLEDIRSRLQQVCWLVGGRSIGLLGCWLVGIVDRLIGWWVDLIFGLLFGWLRLMGWLVC